MVRSSESSASRQGEVRSMVTPDAGAEIQVKRNTSSMIDRMGICMICGLSLGRRDDVVWCRHCGRLAHRGHLIEWIRAKKSCPACDRSLDEEYYR